MKVLYPFSSVNVGGSIVSTSLAAEYAQRSGLECVAVFPYACDASNEFKRQNIPRVFSLNGGFDYYPFLKNTASLKRKAVAGPAFLYEFGKAYRMIKKINPSLVHINGDQFIFTWGMAAKLLNIPVVWHIRMERPSKMDSARLAIADSLIFVADANRVRFPDAQELPPNVTVYNSVDLERFHPASDKNALREKLSLPKDRLLLGFIGNLVERKRPEWVVKAAIELIKQGVPVDAVLVGSDYSGGSYETRLREMIADAGLDKHFHFLGFRPDVENIMQCLDVLALPSVPQGEAFPRVVIEGMATGLAVIATEVAGVPEAITSGSDGIMVDPNSFEDFLAQLNILFTDTTKRAALGRQALIIAQERFSSKASGENIIKMYKDTFSKHLKQ